MNVSQYILGIQPCLDGLTVDPCVPKSLSAFTVVRHFRGAEYRIYIDNSAGVEKGVAKLYCNGRETTGILPVPPAGSRVDVTVIMG